MTTDRNGPAASDVRSRLGSAWHSLTERNVGIAHRLDALQLDPLHVDDRPMLAALDSDGRRHLLVPLPDSSGDVEDSRSAGVNLSTRTLDRPGGRQRYADLVCLRTDLAGVFAGLSADVCTAVIGSPAPGLVVAQKLSAWRELFEAPQQAWSTGRVAGLFAELLVLRSLLELDSSATDAWRGPLGEAQDFRSGGHALEIKATLSPETRMVSVHGWDQLEAPVGGDLQLGWFRLRPDEHGQTVTELVDECLARASAPGDIHTRLDRLAVPPLDSGALLLRLRHVEERWFAVDDSFPAIIPARFTTGHVPTGVISVDYRVDLDTVPPMPVDRAAIVRRFTGHT